MPSCALRQVRVPFVRTNADVHEIPLPTLLSHFLAVILSARTTGVVTQAALEAVTSMLERGLFRSTSAGLTRAVQEIAHATSHCRFEPSDAGRDEVVLLSILDVMAALVCGYARNEDGSKGTPLVDQLGDESVCEMMETCLSMCCQTRLSTALRRTAEQKMLCMTREIFSRLESMPLEEEAAHTELETPTLAAERVGADAESSLRMAMPDPKSQAIPAAGVEVAGEAGDEASAEVDSEAARGAGAESSGAHDAAAEEEQGPLEMPSAHEKPVHETERQGEHEAQEPALEAAVDAPVVDLGPAARAAAPEAPRDVPETPHLAQTQQPFGLPALQEVLRVIISLLDPQSPRHTMTMRLLGLNLLGGLLETHAVLLARFPTLRALLEDSACRYLFQLANTEHGVVVAGSLRVFGILFEQLRSQLKLQQELLLEFILQQLRPSVPWVAAPWSASEEPERPPALSSFRASASGELRELFVEALCTHLMDDADSPDVFLALWRNYDCDLACSNLFEHVVLFLCRAIFAQPATGAVSRTFSGLQLVALDLVLSLVARLADCEGPSDAAADVLRAQHERKRVLAQGADAFNAKPRDGIAFLERSELLAPGPQRARSIARFLKDSALVDKRLLGDYLSRPDNTDVLAEFIDLLDFRECDVAEAMRAMCEAFRLPGEAQQIARVTETFARKYYAMRPPGIASEDAVYVLAYSIIMLNTDLHNPQVTRRMTIADYQKNLRGVNDGGDFDADYLATIYDTIRRREIVMPEEHAGQLGFEYTWKELLRRARDGNVLLPTPRGLDRDVFRASWRPVVASIVHAFSTLQDEHLLQRVIAACRQCAVLARVHHVPDVFDVMVRHFARATGLLDEPLAPDTAVNAEHKVGEQAILVSPLSIAFGRDFKRQLAAVVLFTIAHGNGAAVRTGWGDLVACLAALAPHGLLPASVTHVHTAAADGSRQPLALKAPRSAAAPAAGGSGSGGLLSTLSSYFLSPYGGSTEPLDATESDIENTLCTLDCLASCKMDELHAQLGALPDAPRAALIDALLARLAVLGRNSQVYRPAVVFLLELLADAAERAPQNLARALEQHTAFITDAVQTHPLELQHAVVGAMRLVRAAANAGMDPRAPLHTVLGALPGVPIALHAHVAPALLGGLGQLLAQCGPLADAPDDWARLLHIVATYARVQRAGAAVAALDIAIYLLDHACSTATYAPLVELIRGLMSGADRALWQGARGDSGPRRTLTEKRALSEWIGAVHARSTDALAALARARVNIPDLIRTAPDTSRAWPECWLPLVAALAQPCVNAHRPARQAAVAHLSRVVLSPEMLDPAPRPLAPHLDAMFGNILLPLLDTLLQPETARADALLPNGAPGDEIPVTRTQVCLLLCRAWVQYTGVLAAGVPRDVDAPASARVLRLWTGVLTMSLHVLRAPPTALHEAVDEQLKNAVRVMHVSGLLVEGPPGTLQRGLWVETWRRVDGVRPTWRDLVHADAKAAEAAAREDSSRAGAPGGGADAPGDERAAAAASGGVDAAPAADAPPPS